MPRNSVVNAAEAHRADRFEDALSPASTRPPANPNGAAANASRIVIPAPVSSSLPQPLGPTRSCHVSIA